MAKKQQLLCPKCYEPVFKNGYRNDIEGSAPEDLYHHKKSQNLDCAYNGSVPVGIEKIKRQGFSQKRSRHLKSTVASKRYRRYVITAAQNATPVHKRALESLLTYCDTNDAQLIVVPYRYKNPTSIWSQRAKGHDWWAKEVMPYIMGERVFLCPHLVLLGDIMVQPTAIQPLEGFETITGKDSGVIGHPKLALKTVATPQQKLPKILTTTGAITVKNYIKSKAGKRGEHHHTFGATVVEIEGTHFHMRQLNICNDGSFCDLLAEYSGKKIKRYSRIPALVMGDIHVKVIDPEVVAATFTNPDSMVKILNPEKIIWHDVFDGTSINHHDRGRVFHELVKHRSGQRNAKAEIDETFAFIDHVTKPGVENIFVPSNHHDFLREWVENVDPRDDPENVEFWAETFIAVARSKETRWTTAGVAICDPLAYWGKKKLKTARQAKFLRRDESYLIKGIEVAYHGDRGPNGSRGNRAKFAQIGVKSVIGHSHSPGITDGAYQVGTSSYLNLTYGTGHPTSWLHTHCIIYSNGKRSLVNIIKGSWQIN